jgi:tetratricopeptide (TPR) repeat protein
MAWDSYLSKLTQTLRRLLREARGDLSLPAIASRLTGIGGFLVVLGSALTSWFSVPVAASIEAPIVSESPLVSWAYRAGCIGVSVAAVMILVEGTRRRWRLGRLYVCWFVALLFFPYFISVWSAGVSGRASWLQSQHESLIGINGDNYRAQEYRPSLLRDRVDIVSQRIGTGVFLLPDWERQSLDWSMLQWFGLSRWFASFMKKGWPVALGGTAAVLLALSREAGPAALRTAQKFLKQGVALFLAGLLLALAPVLLCRSCMIGAKRSTQKGEYASARRMMRLGAWCAPAVTQDEDYLIESGLLANALGLQTAEGAYYRARVAEDAGYEAEAQTMYMEGVSADRNQPALQREDIDGLLVFASNKMDSGEVDSATDLFERALAADPVNLKAIYSLQIAYLRSGNIEGLRAMSQRMTDVYDHFNNLLKDPMLAGSTENEAIGALASGDPVGAVKLWTESKTR